MRREAGSVMASSGDPSCCACSHIDGELGGGTGDSTPPSSCPFTGVPGSALGPGSPWQDVWNLKSGATIRVVGNLGFEVVDVELFGRASRADAANAFKSMSLSF